MWGRGYHTVTNNAPQETLPDGAMTNEQFQITDVSPQSLSVAPNTQFIVENKLPQALAITFTRETESTTAHDRITLMIASSSSSPLSFATSGAWKCESNIIRLCGTINVLEAPTH